MATVEFMTKIASAELPTRSGIFRILGFEGLGPASPDFTEPGICGRTTDDLLALVAGELGDGVPLIFVHARCLLCEIFGSCHCDSGRRIAVAMRMIAERGIGAIFYSYDESRSIAAEVLALNQLGGEEEWMCCAQRAIAVLEFTGVKSILMIGTKKQATHFEDSGIQVIECISLQGTERNL